jgi:hypothetical protein
MEKTQKDANFLLKKVGKEGQVEKYLGFCNVKDSQG